MNRLAKQQIEHISRAYRELVDLHPELLKLKNEIVSETISTSSQVPNASAQVTKRKSEIRGMVVQSDSPISTDQVDRYVEELVILTEGRPSMLIRDDNYDLDQYESLPNVFSELLNNNRILIQQAIRAVGRIEVWNHPRRSWVGTGFITQAENGDYVLVTNRHVANEMIVRESNGNFRFVESILGDSSVTASLDLKEEISFDGGETPFVVPIEGILNVEPAEGPDLAFLALGELSPSLNVTPLVFHDLEDLDTSQLPVAAIGYPSKDTRETSLEVVLDLLGDVHNKKRLAPGVVKAKDANRLSHDCSTLGGNSGSPLVNLSEGTVVGVHFGGTFPFPRNVAVPAALVKERLEYAVSQRAGSTGVVPVSESNRSESIGGGDSATRPLSQGAVSVMANPTEGANSGQVSIEIPLRISLEFGTPHVPSQHACNANPPVGMQQIQLPDDLVGNAKMQLSALPGVVNVRSGIKIVNGIYTDMPAIVVAMDSTHSGNQSTLKKIPQLWPSDSGAIDVQVRAASLSDFSEAGLAGGNVVTESVHNIRYQVPEDLSLDPVDEEMFAVFHVAPDAAWPELKEFLSRTDKSLTIALYNFSAEHVKSELHKAVEDNPKKFRIVLGDAAIDRPDTEEFEDTFLEEFELSLNDRFEYERADGARRLFGGHYHTKVAVRDSEAIWLSSGNWEHSNQPDLDPVNDDTIGWELYKEANREWSVVLLNDRLAETFESYIDYDFDSYRELRTRVAESAPMADVPLFLVPRASQVEEMPLGEPTFFKPLYIRNRRLRIQPLMTPDNYLAHVTALVRSATKTIYLQNQTLKWRHERVDERFETFMQVLLEKHRAGVEVRFLLRVDYSPEMKELLIQHGFDADQIRMQSRCHTKGMIVDGKKTLLGSHNLSEHGALINRDASLIVEDEEVAEYFTKIFWYDWGRASQKAHVSPEGVRVYRRGDPIPDGFDLVSLTDVAV